MGTLWLLKKTNVPHAYVDKEDKVVLIQDAVLKLPTKPNWFVCKEDAEARKIKVPPEKCITYEEIAELLLKADRVVVW